MDNLDKPSARTETTPDPYNSAAEEDSAVVKAAAGSLFGFSGYNNSASAVYIQIHNAASLPANSTVPNTGIILLVQPGQSYAWSSGRYGRRMSTGVVIAASSTDTTLTVKTDTAQLFSVDYK